MPLSDFEERRARRAERYREHQANAGERATTAYDGAMQILEHIPPGQPILVGHHSEKRHRRDLARVDSRMAKANEEDKKAKYWGNRANAAESNGAISRLDPEAVTKLEAKIATAERLQALMREANRIVRRKPKNQPTPEKLAALAAAGMPEAKAPELFEPDFAGRLGFPAYALQNNNANLKRMRQRIEKLTRERARPAQEIEVGSVTICENDEFDSTELHFPGKPSEELRTAMKRAGWHWVRRAGCWSLRRRDEHAIAQAKHFAEQYS